MSYYGETSGIKFLSWKSAFEYISDQKKEEKTVNVIDEFPFIAKEEPFSLSDFYDLIAASDIFKNVTERYYYVFVKSGYTQAVLDESKSTT